MTASGYKERFGGIQRLYGIQSSQHFCDMHVCVIGIGGVGSWAAEALARSGIGAITLIDYDEIGTGNINRQIHASSASIGSKKIQVMAERILSINPDCECHLVDDFITDRNLFDHLPVDAGFDYVIDAIDSIRFKAALIYYCKRNRIPVITTGAAGGLTDPTQIRIKDLSRTWNDPLAAKVRSRLREAHGFTRNAKRYFGIECVFSAQQQVYPREDGSVGQEKPGVHGVHLDCNMGYGSATHVTATMGFVAVSRVIEKTLRRKSRG